LSSLNVDIIIKALLSSSSSAIRLVSAVSSSFSLRSWDVTLVLISIFLCFLLALDFSSFIFFFLDLLELEWVDAEVSELLSPPESSESLEEEEEDELEELDESEESDLMKESISGLFFLDDLDFDEYDLASGVFGVTDIT
jgi:hypothetical protein